MKDQVINTLGDFLCGNPRYDWPEGPTGLNKDFTFVSILDTTFLGFFSLRHEM